VFDQRYIGHQFDPYTVPVEAGPLAFFRKVIGAGADDAVPPTYLFTLWLHEGRPFEMLDLLHIDRLKILHGEQSFEYLHPVKVGDHLTFRTTITNIYDKKAGSLSFIERQTEVTNQDQVTVSRLGNTLVVVN